MFGLIKSTRISFSLGKTCSSRFYSQQYPFGNPIPSKKEFLHEFLSFIQTKEQLEFYKKTYGIPGLHRLAVIKIGGEIIEKQLPLLCNSLRFLKDAGLFPVVIHGVGPQMNEELEKRKIEPEYYGGMRITNDITLQLARKLFLQANTKLLNALKESEIPSRSFTSGIFTAEYKDKQKLGYVGEITNVTCDHIYSAIHANEVPVLMTLGETENGQILNINADVAARKLSMELKPFKTIFINSKGGWIEDDGTKSKTIVMSQDYKRLASRDYTGRQGTLLKLNEIKLLLDALPRTSSVVLTSAAGLKHEILDGSSSTGTVCIYEDISQKGDTINQGYVHASSNTGKRKVAVLGARGYVGRELIRLIGQHPELELICASSQGNEGSKVIDITRAPPLNAHTKKAVRPVNYAEHLSIDPEMGFTNLNPQNILSWGRCEDVDIWILALPNGIGQQYVDSIMKIKNNKTMSTGVILDVSADQRFNSDWVYGQPETPGVREKLRNAKLISNPGCYATASQIGLLPLLKAHELSKTKGYKLSLAENCVPYVFGVSGYSGAGTGPSLANNPECVRDNIIAYKSLNHIHEKEISHHLNHPVNFHPHVGPFFQGIHITSSMKLSSRCQDISEIQRLYKDFYDGQRLIHVVDSIPFVKDNAREDHVTVGGFQIDEETGRLVVISTIDNLRKGAATQAIQNANIALGFDEYAGIYPSKN